MRKKPDAIVKVFFIDNSNVDENSLNKSLLHLSRCGSKLFFRKSHKCVKGLLTY